MPFKKRSVARMNGIVTMVEYTDENDIKAYELEPTYQEIGGSGLVNPILEVTAINNTSFDSATNNYYINENGVFITGQENMPANDTITLTAILPGQTYLEDPNIYYNYPYADLAFSGTVTVSNLINCTDADQMITITDPTQPASCTITLS